MKDKTLETTMAQWRRRLWALRTNPEMDYFAKTVEDAPYVSADGTFIPRVRLPHVSREPEGNGYQFPIDDTPYRLCSSSALLVTTCVGGPPVGWQPPNWTIVHEANPVCHIGFLGKAKTPAPTPEVLERARKWIAENATHPDPVGAPSPAQLTHESTPG